MDTRQDIYTVSRLNMDVRALLEDNFALIWVEGEISNFAAPQSGHWYFSLKDASAQVRCALFRSSRRKLLFCPKDGMHVLIRARVSLYENRGEFQLIAEDIEERGEGKLRRAYELLKKKLETAGWFDPARKKPLPPFPTQIGLVTSPTGAAVKDILHVLARRFPSVPIIIYPTLVQGQAAAPQIVRALQIANERQECSVLILARGGGSLEDLWPFNEESVAEAIYHSRLPIISGIGHEIDFTIADFVADRRAPTPSAAAEIAAPDQSELLTLFLHHERQLIRKMRHILSMLIQKLSWTKKHLRQQDPKRRLREKMQHLDFCQITLTQWQHRLLAQLRHQLIHLQNRLQLHSPARRLERLTHQLNTHQLNLNSVFKHFLNQKDMHLAQLAGKLHALSPLATLQRGYAIVLGHQLPVLTIREVKQGDAIEVHLHDGSLACVVEKTRPFNLLSGHWVNKSKINVNKLEN